jgi:hypothetical protein
MVYVCPRACTLPLFHGGNRGSNPLGDATTLNSIDIQGFFSVLVPPDAAVGKSGTLLLLACACSNVAA